MNKARRKTLAAVTKRLSEIMDEIEEIKALSDELSNLRDEIDTACDEEQDAFAALSEGAQANDRGQAMESAISNMVEATDGLTDLITALDGLELASVVEALEAAAE
jgi:predicted  nucleic acid-binding Zn-ribbon protein